LRGPQRPILADLKDLTEGDAPRLGFGVRLRLGAASVVVTV
jgi:hypothetical protein